MARARRVTVEARARQRQAAGDTRPLMLIRSEEIKRDADRGRYTTGKRTERVDLPDVIVLPDEEDPCP